jgi:hypothetical protein
MKYYIHSVPGRLRIESPELRDNPAKKEELESFMKNISGISAVEVPGMSGSAIIHFKEDRLRGDYRDS